MESFWERFFPKAEPSESGRSIWHCHVCPGRSRSHGCFTHCQITCPSTCIRDQCIKIHDQLWFATDTLRCEYGLGEPELVSAFLVKIVTTSKSVLSSLLPFKSLHCCVHFECMPCISMYEASLGPWDQTGHQGHSDHCSASWSDAATRPGLWMPVVC